VKIHSCWKRWQFEQRPSGFWSKPEQRIYHELETINTFEQNANFKSQLQKGRCEWRFLESRVDCKVLYLSSSTISASNCGSLPRRGLGESHLLRTTSSIILLIASVISILSRVWSIGVLLVCARIWGVAIWRWGVLRVVL
jgi:hypothetical protein